jgi:hypothetical protein
MNELRTADLQLAERQSDQAFLDGGEGSSRPSALVRFARRARARRRVALRIAVQH